MANPVVHFEIGCKDGAKSQEFFSKLFSWGFQEFGPARMINTGSEEGIHGHLEAGESTNTIIYVRVDDLQACLDKAESLGGKTIVPPTEVPEAGHFAQLTDSDGTTVGIWKPL